MSSSLTNVQTFFAPHRRVVDHANHSLSNDWMIRKAIIILSGAKPTRFSLTAYQYMFVLVVVFIILFGVSVAALAMSSSQQHTLLQEGWGHLSNETKGELQRLGNCCGFEDKSVTAGPYGHPSCAKVSTVHKL